MTKIARELQLTNRIHVFRAEQRLSQEELAKAVGVTRGTIVALEGGNYNPSLELAFRLARYFNTSIEALFSVHENIQALNPLEK